MPGNILDYLEWRGDLPFTYNRFNAIDALILSTITYINYPNADENVTSFRKGYEEWLKLPDDEKYRGLAVVKRRTEKLAGAISESKRFKDVRITAYVEHSGIEIEKQFSAMSFLFPDGNVFIAFRGTDHTLVGWKEDFNMAVIDGTPSQLEATEYVTMIANRFPDARIALGGHSKGGNLAIWAASHLPEDIKKRLVRVYCFDSPGLSRRVVESEGYQSVRDRTFTFVPEASIVGIIMYNPPQLVVSSDAEGFMQHDPFSWQVSRRSFVYLTERSAISRHLEKRLDKTVQELDHDEYIRLVNRVYDDLRETADVEKSVRHFLHKAEGITARLRRKR
ncbi:MAG: DUF2974 domain-containing protein [Clostridiales bacterium]|nr:DUF2974 domain-containing protein [Candidatus Crickella caballi]